MATTAPSPRPVSITIPAAYLEDARNALSVEIASDSEALASADAVDRALSALILRRDVRLLDPLLKATGETELTSESDMTSTPLLHVLEALIRLLVGRLRNAAQYGPLPMGDVADLAAELGWAAEEAIRIEPALAIRLTLDERKAVA